MAPVADPTLEGEEIELIGVGGAGNPPMGTRVDAVYKSRESLAECLERPVPAARKPLLAPDLVEAPGIAAVAPDQVPRAYLEPARDPDFDRIRFRERSLRQGGLR